MSCDSTHFESPRASFLMIDRFLTRIRQKRLGQWRRNEAGALWSPLVIPSSPGKTAARAVFTDQSPIRGGNRGYRQPCWREVLSEALPCFCTLSFCVTILNLYFITNNNIFLHEMCALYVKLLITIEIIRDDSDDSKYLYRRLFIWNNSWEYSGWSYSSIFLSH